MEYFVNRTAELHTMEDAYRERGSAFLVMYGRRRLGKTTLIRQFIKDKPAVYYLATEEGESQNRDAFREVTADFTNNRLLRTARIEDWAAVFEALLSCETLRNDARKLVIVIDEFQYLGLSNPAFPSIIQKLWDTKLKDRHIMLILCGSFISMMESQTLSYQSPLYGRRTGQIKVKQIPFHHYKEFFPDKDRSGLVLFYAVTGGVPKYIEVFHNYQDIYEAIRRDVLSPNSFLYEEPVFLLRQELGQAGGYFSIIKTIAAGNHKPADIAGAFGVKQPELTQYLTTLINLDILEREVPVTEKNPEKSKRILYHIKDNFILFWFKFVYPNISHLESGNESLVMQKLRRNFIDNHISFVYEAVCRDGLLRQALPWAIDINKAGRWWDNNHEIDLVAFDNEGQDIIFGECKYWKHPVGVDVFYKLLEKAGAVDWKRGERREYYLLFSINGFTEELTALAREREDLALSD